MAHVFVSYSTKNSEYAYKLAKKLRDEGFDVWMDNARLRASDKWWQSIVLALKDCAAFVVLMSPESKDSRWVQREVMLADNWQKPIFPVLLAGENWELFVDTHYEDVSKDGGIPPQYMGKLPSRNFIDELAVHALRTGTSGTDVTAPTIANPDELDSAVVQQIATPPEIEETTMSIPSKKPFRIRIETVIVVALIAGACGVIGDAVGIIPAILEYFRSTPTAVVVNATNTSTTDIPTSISVPTETMLAVATTVVIPSIAFATQVVSLTVQSTSPIIPQSTASALAAAATMIIPSLPSIPPASETNTTAPTDTSSPFPTSTPTFTPTPTHTLTTLPTATDTQIPPTLLPTVNLSETGAEGMACGDSFGTAIVSIPEITSFIGLTDTQAGPANERPGRSVRVSAFCMDVYEVTNASYTSCVNEGVCTPPRRTDAEVYGQDYYTENPLLPVVNVTWEQAQTFCENRGGRLPTEAEWELAARYDPVTNTSRPYPWGDASAEGDMSTDSDDRANFNGLVIKQGGQHPSGANPYGVQDLSGNVAEWVYDWFGPYERSQLSDPQGAPNGSLRVVRGGSYTDDADHIRGSYRGSQSPNVENNRTGFRCIIPR